MQAPPLDRLLDVQAGDIRRHFRAALRRGWPRILILNRRGADARRNRRLQAILTRDGLDRDEHPAGDVAAVRATASSATASRGSKAEVSYVPGEETARTARCSASSFGASATAPGSGTSSTRSA
jgi:hypothetical protein